MPIHRLNIWAELAKELFEYAETNEIILESDIEEIINKFVSKRIARCYFMISKSEADKVTCPNGGD